MGKSQYSIMRKTNVTAHDRDEQFSCVVPAILWQTDRPNEETQLRYPFLNSHNLTWPSTLAVGSFAPPATVHQASSLSTCALSGLPTSTRTRNFHLSAIVEQSLKTYNSSKYVQTWCVSQEHRQVYVPVAVCENPHMLCGSSPSITL